jgi:hypothetical protein
MDLQAEAARLNSEGAQMQYVAFGKVCAGVMEAIRQLKSHDTLAAIKSLEEVARVADLCLDVIKRAGTSSRLWPAATLYKKRMMTETSDVKHDKIWAECVANSKAVVKSKPVAGDKRKASFVPGVLHLSSEASSGAVTSPFVVRGFVLDLALPKELLKS